MCIENLNGKQIYSISKTPENISLFNKIFNIAEANGKLIYGVKLTATSLSFVIKNNNPFAVCEFLTDEQIVEWMNIINFK